MSTVSLKTNGTGRVRRMTRKRKGERSKGNISQRRGRMKCSYRTKRMGRAKCVTHCGEKDGQRRRENKIDDLAIEGLVGVIW